MKVPHYMASTACSRMKQQGRAKEEEKPVKNRATVSVGVSGENDAQSSPMKTAKRDAPPSYSRSTAASRAMEQKKPEERATAVPVGMRGEDDAQSCPKKAVKSGGVAPHYLQSTAASRAKQVTPKKEEATSGDSALSEQKRKEERRVITQTVLCACP